MTVSPNDHRVGFFADYFYKYLVGLVKSEEISLQYLSTETTTQEETESLLKRIALDGGKHAVELYDTKVQEVNRELSAEEKRDIALHVLSKIEEELGNEEV